MNIPISIGWKVWWLMAKGQYEGGVAPTSRILMIMNKEDKETLDRFLLKWKDEFRRAGNSHAFRKGGP